MFYIFYIYIIQIASLVGALEHFLFFHIIIGNVIIPTDELIFFRGVGSTTNQTTSVLVKISGPLDHPEVGKTHEARQLLNLKKGATAGKDRPLRSPPGFCKTLRLLIIGSIEVKTMTSVLGVMKFGFLMNRGLLISAP